jgi:hypothetical protein
VRIAIAKSSTGWISPQTFAAAFEVQPSGTFSLDIRAQNLNGGQEEGLTTVGCRFVSSPQQRFDSLLSFVALAITTSGQPELSYLDWARSCVLFPILQTSSMLESKVNAIQLTGIDPCDWLQFDGEVIEAFEIEERGEELFAYDFISRQFAQTEKSYYYIEIFGDYY